MSGLLRSVTSAIPGLRARTARPPWFEGQVMIRDRWIPDDVRGTQTNPDLRRLLIIHPPKTAGSSLRLMFARHVPREQTLVATGQHEWTRNSPESTRDIRLFVGHQFLEPLYRHPDDDWVTVLPVREPLSWWRSWYTWRRGLLHAARDFTDPMTVLTMSEWVDGRRDIEMSNPQSSWLLARTRLMFDSVAAVPGRVAATGAELWNSPAEVVELLGRLADAVTVLGTTEDVLGMYQRSCAAMGWEPRYTSAVRENRSSHAPELVQLRPDQIERLRRLNRLDTWLHTRAGRDSVPPPAAPPAPR